MTLDLLKNSWLIVRAIRYSTGYLPLTLALTLSIARPVCAETIEYLFFELKPRMMIIDGEVGGVVGSKAMDIFKQAHLKVNVTSSLPANRILSLLRADTPNLCSVGWFKTLEREQYYRYSLPIFHDPQHIIVTLKANKIQFDNYKNLHALLSDPNQILGKTRGLSFGQDLDHMLSQAHTPIYDVNSYQEMFMMLATGRFQYIVTDVLELETILEQAKLLKADFISYEFDDMPAGETRHILCSQATSADIITRIDQAIKSASPSAN